MLAKLWHRMMDSRAKQAVKVQMNLTPELLNALLLYLPADDPDARELTQHLQNVRSSLYRQGESPPADPLGLLSSETFLRTLIDVAHQHSGVIVRRQAAERLAPVALKRGLTPQQLEDRLVPSCGLDGSLLFDYGARQFAPVLGNNHTPLLREQSGRLRTSLPRPVPTDDAELVAHATQLWRTHKRQLSQASRTQTARLEQAMIDRHRWSPAEFTHSMLGHPLLAELAGRLIWAGYAADGALLDTFCLTDRHSPASETYAPIELDRYAAIGLPHPINVVPERRLRWAEMLSDFHVAPLFLQAGRPVYSVNESEQQAVAITRFQAISLHGDALQSALSQYGWAFVHTQSSATRWFQGAQVVATIKISSHVSTHRMVRCSFERVAETAAKKAQKLPLRNVDPIVLSEVLWNMSEISANPKLLV